MTLEDAESFQVMAWLHLCLQQQHAQFALTRHRLLSEGGCRSVRAHRQTGGFFLGLFFLGGGGVSFFFLFFPWFFLGKTTAFLGKTKEKQPKKKEKILKQKKDPKK